jgi:hypothetical protein
LAIENTLAYYCTVLFTVTKGFMIQDPMLSSGDNKVLHLGRQCHETMTILIMTLILIEILIIWVTLHLTDFTYNGFYI